MRRLAAALLCGLAACAAPAARRFRDDFSVRRPARCVRDGGRLGRWAVLSTGFGCVRQAPEGWLEASVMPSVKSGETHAFLLTGPRAAAPFTLTARLSTVERTRAVTAANDWEAAWLVWDFADSRHFYYFVARPGGWELGKRDPAYLGGQRFLASGTDPVFPVGSWARVSVRQESDGRLIVNVDGRVVAEFLDTERPYRAGRIGLYGEDCTARFDDVELNSPGT
ncbi:MAG: calcium-binding protein [Elusimicrobia bacterium]|nr:calcium-binding protein [Elusimicrobiota bacterium]